MASNRKDESSVSVAQWVEALERDCMQRDGVKLPEARVTIARRLGVAPGTLENLRRNRTKGPRVGIVEKLRAAMIALLQSEMRRLDAQLEMVRRCGGEHREHDIRAAAAALADARKVLSEAPTGEPLT